MRRNDREITDPNEIFAMLERCTTVSLGVNTGEFPYVIPMTFGCRVEDGRLCVYFHCAGEGRKWELLRKDPRVCVEGHVYERVARTEDGGITAMYESVIGFGTAVLLTETAEKVDAVKLILAHYNSSGFPATSCQGLKRVEAFRIVLDEVTGKRSK